MRQIIIVIGVISILLAGGHSSSGVQSAQPSPGTSCTASLKPYLRTSLYMDRLYMDPSKPNVPSREISEEEWQGFVNDVLLRHFPAGGTIYGNAGWWRRPDGGTDGGRGQTLVILAPVAEADSHSKAVKAVIGEVKKRYRHRSVLWVQEHVCAAF